MLVTQQPLFLKNLTHSYHYCVLFVIAFISWKCVVCLCSRYSQYMQILFNFFFNLSFFFPRNLLINWISFCFYVSFAQNWNPQFQFPLLNLIAWVEGWDFFKGSIEWHVKCYCWLMRMERETNVFTVLAINPAFVPFLIDETVTVDTSTHQMTRILLYTLYIVHHALASHRQKRSDIIHIEYAIEKFQII